MKAEDPKHSYLFCLLVALLLCLCSCSSKSTATYLPPKEHHQTEQQSVNSDEIAISLKLHFRRWQGTRYRIGGLSRNGIDCSGFTLLTYKELFRLTLPRTAREQVKRGEKVSRKALRAGDLVFFKTGIFQRHVGIYLENQKFIHASQSKGVMISDLNNSYWQKKYWKAKRL
jgi:probable lipoprotein NlpC